MSFECASFLLSSLEVFWNPAFPFVPSAHGATLHGPHQQRKHPGAYALEPLVEPQIQGVPSQTATQKHGLLKDGRGAKPLMRLSGSLFVYGNRQKYLALLKLLFLPALMFAAAAILSHGRWSKGCVVLSKGHTGQMQHRQ